MLNLVDKLYKSFGNPVKSTTRPNTGLHPSAASIIIDGELYGSCHRQEYYNWYGYKKTEKSDPEGMLAAFSGEALHDAVCNIFETYKFELGIDIVSKEHSFYDKDQILSGRCDLIVRERSTGKIHGVEIKTVGEYKTGLTILEPDITHILQSMVYLDLYNKHIPNGYQKIDDWIILYLARSETYKTRNYKHGSPFKQMWQFSICLEDDGSVSVTDLHGKTTNKKDITIQKIYDRNTELLQHIKSKNLPDREYIFQYDEDTIVGMHKTGKLLKKQQEVVQKWLDKGAPENQLVLDLGDFECRYCSWKSKCYSQDPVSYEPKEEFLIKLPKLDGEKTDNNGQTFLF